MRTYANLQAILTVMGDKWSLSVLFALTAGPTNFGAVRRSIDRLSPRMLAQTLRGLQREALVNREVHSLKPPRVVYSLTTRGRELAQHLSEIGRWADEAEPPRLETPAPTLSGGAL